MCTLTLSLLLGPPLPFLSYRFLLPLRCLYVICDWTKCKLPNACICLALQFISSSSAQPIIHLGGCCCCWGAVSAEGQSCMFIELSETAAANNKTKDSQSRRDDALFSTWLPVYWESAHTDVYVIMIRCIVSTATAAIHSHFTAPQNGQSVVGQGSVKKASHSQRLLVKLKQRRRRWILF